MTGTKLITVYFAAGVVALLAWVLNAAQLYWMAGVLFLLPYASRLFSRIELHGLSLEREMPPAVHQGELVPVRLHARNSLALPKLQLSVDEQLPSGLISERKEPLPLYLGPRAEDELEYSFRAGRRGAYTLSTLRIYATDLLGLAKETGTIEAEAKLVVYPRVIELPDRLLPPDLGGGHAPLESAQRQGEGASFFGIREYRPGDPLRHVHWRTAARLGKLTVVEWDAEESRNAVVAVETQSGSERPLGTATTLDLAAGMAASLASRILGTGDTLRLLAPGFSSWKAAPDRGLEVLPALLEALARMRAEEPASVAVELRRVAPQLEPGTVVCWLAPRPDTALLETARYLQVARLRPVIYALLEQPSGRPSDWDSLLGELQSFSISVIRVYPHDEVVAGLLATGLERPPVVAGMPVS